MTRAAALVLACATLLGACGGDGDGGDRTGRETRGNPFDVVERERAQAPRRVRAAPRWEPVTALRGRGSARHEVTVAPGAIQWRANWTCRRGNLRVAVEQEDADPSPLVRSGCPASGEASSVRTGAVTLDVAATGGWRLEIEQQVDTPIEEPPLPAMKSGAAQRLATGRFYALERRGRGAATLYRMPGGRLAVRLERFETAASADLFVWIGHAARPRTSRQALRTPHVELAPIKATAGSQNYLLPEGMTRDQVGSLIIWCEPIRIAYAAASLRGRSVR